MKFDGKTRARPMTSAEKDWCLEEKLAAALREECLQIFGSTWNLDNAHRLARRAIQTFKQWPALTNGERDGH